MCQNQFHRPNEEDRFGFKTSTFIGQQMRQEIVVPLFNTIYNPGSLHLQ